MVNTELFETMQRDPSLRDKLAAQIEGMIVEQRLQPGDKLPSERELSALYGVSRTVIREAVATLTAKSLLEPQRGGGILVKAPDIASVSRSLTLCLRLGRPELTYDKVHEVRSLIEVEIAGLAALRRTDEDIQALETLLDAIDPDAIDRTAFAQVDVAFHRQLAAATHNDLYSVILDSIADVLIDVRTLGYDVPGTPERAIIHHREILDEVRRGDAAAARDAMSRHLIEAQVTQRDVMGEK